jgi:hypothetical protein
MRVFYLYGPPGVGKLTVGTSLAALTGFRLFHNHLTVNLATAVFPRETEPWRELIRHVRALLDVAPQMVERTRGGTGQVEGPVRSR